MPLVRVILLTIELKPSDVQKPAPQTRNNMHNRVPTHRSIHYTGEGYECGICNIPT